MVTQLDPPPPPPRTITITESSSSSITNSLNHMMINNNTNNDTTFSYSSNIMLAAIISLLIVILFILLLHLYAKWFLSQSGARRRSTRTTSTTTNSQFLGASRFHTFTFDTIFFADSQSKGLDDSTIRSIPVFIYNPSELEVEQGQGQECVICLSDFEKNQTGKKLPKCGHAFHVECIDTWLHSQCNCPICRAPVVVVSEPERLSETVPTDQLGLVEAADSSSSLSSTLEIVIEMPPGLCKNGDSSSSCSSSKASQQSLPATGCSFKRMLSRSRSVECKVHPPSSSNSELVS